MTRLCAMVAILSLVSPVPAAELSTLNGKKFSGDLVSIDEHAVTIKTSEGEVQTRLADILTLNLKDGAAKPPAKFTDVELVDGTLFHCAKVELKNKKAILELQCRVKLTVEMSSITYILNDAQIDQNRKEFNASIADRTKSDRFFVHKDGRLDGLEGTFGDASADGSSIAFTDQSGDKRALPLDRLAALLFNNRLEGNIPETACRVTDAFDDLIIAQKSVLKDKSLRLLTVAGVAIDYPTLEPVMALDYSKDKIVYLSDMKPIAEEKLFDELAVICTRDANLDNQPIELEGVPYAKGMVLHAPLTMSFDLGAKYKEFKAVVGVDTAVQTPSDVRLIFEADGRKLFEMEVKVKDAPKSITLDVKKVRQFTVRVSQTSGLPFGHQVTLADAKVTK